MTRLACSTGVFFLACFVVSSAVAQPEPPEAYPAPPEAVPAPPPTHQPTQPPPGQPGYVPPGQGYAYPPAPVLRRRPSNRITQRFAVYGELLGKGFLYGIGLDFNFTKWLGIGGSFSYVKIGDFTAGTAAPYLSFYAGGFSGAFVAQGGPLFLFGRESSIWDTFDRVVLGQVSIGYEYRNGFLFRVLATTFFHQDAIIPGWPGFTFGGAF